jgi:hypothetical protein
MTSTRPPSWPTASSSSRAAPPAEAYLREVWPAVTSALKEHGVACELNLVRSEAPCSRGAAS